VARREFLERLPLRLHVELLQPRMLMSVAPAGGELLLNQAIGSTQQSPAVAVDASGNTVAVWQSLGEDGDGWGIYGRRFDPSGNALGNEFLVNTTTTHDQVNPAIVLTSSGAFVVVWTSNQSGAQAVYGRGFNADGTPRGNEFQVSLNTTPMGSRAPAVAMDGSGNLVVAWEGNGSADSDGVYYRRYQSTLQPSGPESLVNTTTSSSQFDPSIGMNAGGAFVIAWTDNGSGAGKIAAQRFNQSGNATGSQFQVGTTGGNHEDFSQVGVDSAGNFTVAWADNFGGPRESDVYTRRYTAGGVALDANPAFVNTFTNSAQTTPSLGERADGKYFIAWTSTAQDGDGLGIFGKAFNADGTPDGTEIRINSTTHHNQRDPAVAWNGNAATVVWDGEGVGTTQGIFGQFFLASSVPPLPNQSPATSVPGAQSVAEGGTVTLSSGGSNAISVSDPNGATGTEQVTLTATHGTLTLATTAGISITAGTGTANATVTFQGSLASLNAALDGLTFTPATNYSGSASIQVTINDLGNTGSGGPLSASGSVAVTVTPVAHTPSISDSTVQQNNQTTTGLIISRNPLDGAAVGFFQITNIVGGTLFQNDGTTPINAGDFITYAQGNAGLKFTPTSNSTANGNFDVQASTTNNGTGLGGGIVTATITVGGPPVNSVPGPQTVAEDGSLIFSAATSNPITVDDALILLGTDTVALTATNGTLTLSGHAGLSFSAGSDGTSSMTFSGTLTSLNAALNGMTFTPTSLFHGSAGIQIDTTDLGNIFHLGPLTTTSNIGITVTPVAHTPTVTNAATSENQQTSSGLVITPNAADAGVVVFFQITGITNGTLFQSNGVTPIGEGDFITAAQGAAGLHFTPAPNSVAPGSFSVQASTTNTPGGLGGSVVTASVTVNSPPTIALSTGELSYTEAQAPAAIDPGLTISDVDNSTLAGATVQLFRYRSNQDVLAFTNQNGITGSFNSTTGVLTLSGTATVAQYQAALRSVTYSNTSSDPDRTTRAAEFAANDGLARGTPVYRAITVTAVNNAPVNHVPGLQTVNEDTPIVFSTTNSNAISITDVDSDGGIEQVTLSATGGTLTLSGVTGLTLAAGTTGTNDTNPSFKGTLADINAALNGMTFTPTLHSSGSAGIGIVSNDLGNTGTGTPPNVSSGVSVLVTAVAHTPSVSNAATNENHQTTGGLIVTPSALDAALSGFFKITAITGGTLFQSDGTTPIADGSFITFAQGQAGLRFSPATNSIAGGSFSVQASTSGSNAGLAGTVITAAITVNGPPVLGISAGQVGYTELQSPVAIDPGLTVSFAGNATLSGAVIQLTGYVVGQDVIGYVDQSGISGSWDTTSGVLTLTGTATIAEYQAALRSITYANWSGDPSSTTRTAEFTVSGGGLTSATIGRDIAVIALTVRPPPTLVTNKGLTLEGVSRAAITAGLLEVTGPAAPEQITYTLTTVPAHGVLRLRGAALAAGSSFTQADINHRRLAFERDGTSADADEFHFTASDDSGASIEPAIFVLRFRSAPTLPVTTPAVPALLPVSLPPLQLPAFQGVPEIPVAEPTQPSPATHIDGASDRDKTSSYPVIFLPSVPTSSPAAALPLPPRRSNTTQNDAPMPLPPRKSSGDTAQAQSVAAAPGASRNPIAARPSEAGRSLDGMLSLAHGGAAGAS
ncbi:MAG: uncharacterized protein JWM97_972, partial [Phycisphaerales bacterium]|nr:uncharacterized protein [Phycisphaerales bacterium]